MSIVCSIPLSIIVRICIILSKYEFTSGLLVTTHNGIAHNTSIENVQKYNFLLKIKMHHFISQTYSFQLRRLPAYYKTFVILVISVDTGSIERGAKVGSIRITVSNIALSLPVCPYCDHSVAILRLELTFE